MPDDLQSGESRRAVAARPRAAGAEELVEIWRNPFIPVSSLGTDFFCTSTGFESQVVDSFSVKDDTGIVGFEFQLDEISPTTGFVVGINRTNPGTDFTVAIWEENFAIARICYEGAQDGELCPNGDGDCPDGRCGGLPMPHDEPSYRSAKHNLGDGVVTIVDTANPAGDFVNPAVFMNFGAEVFQAQPGNTYWTGITGLSAVENPDLFVCRSWLPMSDCGGCDGCPAVFELFTDCDGLPGLQQSDPTWTPVALGGSVVNELTMAIFAFPRDGGSAVVTVTGVTDGSPVTLIPTTAPIPGCGNSCTTDLGASCGANGLALAGGMSAEAAAAAIAADIQTKIDGNLCIGPDVCAVSRFSCDSDADCDDGEACVASGITFEVAAFGNRVIFRADDGGRPKWCLGGTPLGGAADCDGSSGGLQFRVGAAPDEVLPKIAQGIDRIGTGGSPGATFATIALNLGEDFFGLGSDAFVGTIDLVGAARVDALDNSPLTLQRNSDIVYAGCSGDGVLTGTVDDADECLLECCFNNLFLVACPQCDTPPRDAASCLEKYDYTGEGALDQDDRDVFDCLLYTGNNSGCCPGNLNVDPPQSADRLVLAEVSRLLLKSADPIDVSFGGDTERWLLDVTLSSEDALVGSLSTTLGVCDDLTASEPNDFIDEATADIEDLDGGVLVGDPRTPVRIRGAINADNPNPACRANDGFDGDTDGDLYQFVIAPEAAVVSISVDGRLTNIEDRCGGEGALAAVYLYNSAGTLIDFDDGLGLREPDFSAALNPGTYFVLVVGAGPPQPPDIKTGPCAVTSPPDVLGGVDVTGAYDLNLTIVDSSTYKVKQTAFDAVSGAGSGTFEAVILVQGRLAFHPIGDPFRSAILDTGEEDLFGVREEAWVISAEGDWVSSLSAELQAAGVQQGNTTFVIGVTENGARGDGAQSTSPISFETEAGPLTIVAEGWTGRNSCDNVLDDATYVHELDKFPVPGTEIIRARVDEFQGSDGELSTLADRFVLDADATIGSVSLFLAPIADEQIDDFKFDLGIYPETTLEGGCLGPDMSAGSPPLTITTLSVTHSQNINTSSIDADRITLNLPGGGVALTGGTPYWLVVRWNRDLTELLDEDVEGDEDNGDIGKGLATPVRFLQAIPGSPNTDGTYLLDAEGTGPDPRCDTPGPGNGFQCTERPDNPATLLCNEFDADGDLTQGNVAFSLHPTQVERRTKALPSGLAQGSWSLSQVQPSWQQPRNIDTGNGGLSDDAAGGGSGSRQADNFTAFQEMNIRHITWWGRYFPSWDTPTVPDKFTIRFYDDLNGLPGNLRTPIPLDAANVTREAVELFGVPGVVAQWKYSVDLVDVFGAQGILNVPANETRWISIVNDTAATDDYAWVWSTGIGGDFDGISADFVPVADATKWVQNARDFAFELAEGGPVYEVDIVDGEVDLAIHLDAVDGGQGLSYIHGTDVALLGDGDANPEANAVRWHYVSAPLKMYNVYTLPSDTTAGALLDGTAPSEALDTLGTGMAEISQQDLESILGQAEGLADATVIAVFRGLADYAVNNDENGTTRHGRIEFLCDNAIAYFIDPAEDDRIVGPQALEVKGLMFADDARGGSAAGSTASLYKARQLVVLNPDNGQRSLERECNQGQLIECDGQMIDCPVDGTCPIPPSGVACDTNEVCATAFGDGATFCTFDSCVDGKCEFTPGKFADVATPGGICGPDEDVGLPDILAVLDGFGGSFFAPCTRGNIDIGGSQQSCEPDGDIGLPDILHVLDAFAGGGPCGPICAAGGPPAIKPPARRLADRRPSSSAAASYTLVPSDRSVTAGGQFSVDVYVSGATGLRGYQVSLAATGGRTGSLELIDVVIWSERSDFVLNGSANVVTDDLSRGRVAAALHSDVGVDSGDNAYLATFTFRASDNAAGGFDLSIETSASSLVGVAHRDIPVADASIAIRVGSERGQRSKTSRRR